ncbi:MAG: carboxylate--amine ligase, partial [Halanaerobium sp.]
VRERFFHFEYFKLDDGRIVALEVNIRPPGGPVLAMFNYANDIDIYRKYAEMITQAEFDSNITRKYNCFYVGRKNLINYQHSLEDILNNYGDLIVEHEAVSPILAAAMGDYGFILRTKEIEKGNEAVEYILAKL